MRRFGPGRPLAGEARADEGFSLVEVLLTLFLLSLMSVLIVYAMRGGNAATERTRQLGEQSEIWAVQRYLRDAINGAQTLPIAGSGSFMDGEADRLTFVTSHTVPGQFGGFYVTTLSTRPDPDTPDLADLWIDQTLFQRHGNVFGEARDVMPRSNVLHRIARLRLRYFGIHGTGQKPEWTTTWTEPSRLPELIELYVDFADSDARIWPTLAVTTPVTD